MQGCSRLPQLGFRIGKSEIQKRLIIGWQVGANIDQLINLSGYLFCDFRNNHAGQAMTNQGDIRSVSDKVFDGVDITLQNDIRKRSVIGSMTG